MISNLVFFLFFNRYLESLGANEAQIGLYMGSMALGSVVSRPLVGSAVDTYGPKRMIYFGLLIMIAANIGYFFCRELNWFVALVRIAHGIGFGCHITGIFTVVVDEAPATRRAKIIGVFGLSGMGTFAVLPIIAELIIKHFSFQVLFGAGLAAVTAGLAVSVLIKARGPATLEFPPLGFLGLLRQRDLFVPLGALFVFTTGVGAIVNFIAVYLGQMNISVTYFFVTNSIAGAIVRLFLGHMADVYGRRRVAVPSFLAGSMALVWLGLFHYPWELLACGLVWGAGIGFAVPAVAASIVDRVKPQDRGKGMALFTASFDLGVMAGSLTYGTVAASIGYSRMYVVAAGVVLISAWIARSFRN